MTKLQRLYAEHGQSPWLDNLTRTYVHDGTLSRLEIGRASCRERVWIPV